MSVEKENCCRYCGSDRKILYYYKTTALCKQCFIDNCAKTMPKLPHLCAECGEMDSNNFYKNRSKCKKCYTKQVLDNKNIKKNTGEVKSSSPLPIIKKKKIIVRLPSSEDD